jgi:hypothetical protein
MTAEAAAPCFLARRVRPLIAACKSFASVGKVTALGCTVVSTLTRARSSVRSVPASCATCRLSARTSSSLSPIRGANDSGPSAHAETRAEELLTGEVPEVQLRYSALAHAFIK